MADVTRSTHTTIVLDEWESHLLGSFLSCHTPLGVELSGHSVALLEALKLTGTPASDEGMKALIEKLIQRLYP